MQAIAPLAMAGAGGEFCHSLALVQKASGKTILLAGKGGKGKLPRQSLAHNLIL